MTSSSGTRPTTPRPPVFRGHDAGRRLAVRLLVLALSALGGCLLPERVHVSTMTAPGASFSSQRTFRFLRMSETRAVQPGAASADDPMLENSITGRAVRGDIAQALVSRGYVRHRDTADLAIAYYIGSRSTLVVTDYDYGYPFSDWKGAGTPSMQVPSGQYEYKEGTVIVDVLDATAKHVLWRGVGLADITVDPKDYARVLGRTVSAIMDRFPGRAPPTSVTLR